MNRIVILDRSGSMVGIVDDTIGGFNAFVHSQKSLGGKISLYLFDDKVEEVYKDRSIGSVNELNAMVYTPRGSTALLDAIGHVITTTTFNRDEQNTVIIITDGHENTSVNYSNSAIKELIQMKQNEGVTFLFMGADQDAFDEARKYGIGADDTLSFKSPDIKDAFRAASNCVEKRYTVDNSTPLTPEPSVYAHNSA